MKSDSVNHSAPRSPGPFGPGLLVTAAFIGPGTVTTASVAGASFGYALLWALLFSVIATAVLQEMSARLGLVTRQGLAQALRDTFSGRWYGTVAVILVVAAVGFGNAAYEAGNITGAALGLQGLSGVDGWIWSLLVGGASGALLFSGRYKMIEGVLVVLVLLMSTVFLLTFIMVRPSLAEFFGGMLRPTLPEGSLLTAIALIGTTVVPYNLFLHSSAVQEKWPASEGLDRSLRAARVDTGVSIGLGGLITLAIMSTAAAAFFGSNMEITAANIAVQLEPLLGSASRYFFAIGLFAAGLSSAVAAPLAAAYAVSGALGWQADLASWRFRSIWLAVLLCGTFFAVIGTKPLTAILFAQAANGFLLPICAIFLLLMVNRKAAMGGHCNGLASNLLGAVVVAVTLGLGGLKLYQVLF
ncbi:manganese transporter [Halioglobus japonicus]|uniref:Nramp family divalent metal transporter n=1 Tax=Halioglobus japonicus TaxID=930805 RepID=UPI0009793065|nr:Nramp family divalent metal transporter [Halioglobus japonicus]AQA19660.1 manganese transporter [Halioglobus japonicus]